MLILQDDYDEEEDDSEYDDDAGSTNRLRCRWCGQTGSCAVVAIDAG